MGKGLLIIFKVHFCYLNILNVLKCCFLPNAVCVKLTPPFQFFYLERVLIARGQLQPNKTGHPGEELSIAVPWWALDTQRVLCEALQPRLSREMPAQLVAAVDLK